MRAIVRTQTEELAGSRLATSAQPPCATRPPAANAACEPTPCPVRSVPLVRTPGALRQGLRCLTAPCLLPGKIFKKFPHQFRECERRIR